MAKSLKRIAITGAAGQIAYSLLFRIASGDMLGGDQPIALHLLEVPQMEQALGGVAMELEDCAFPLLREVRLGSDPYALFEGVHYALLVGSKPRGAGMERRDLLLDNGKIFVEQGRALNERASRELVTLVVGNPCNTNCLIAMKHAPQLDARRFFAMTMLDQNRACSLLAHKAGVAVSEVTNLVIWGNHSSTQVPDFLHAKIGGQSVGEVMQDEGWLQKEFISQIQKRGAAVIAARGKSSAASAAHAAIETMKRLLSPTPPGRFFSVALCSDGNPYGVAEGLVFSFPCISLGEGRVQIVEQLDWDPFLRGRIQASERELLEEKELIAHLFG